MGASFSSRSSGDARAPAANLAQTCRHTGAECARKTRGASQSPPTTCANRQHVPITDDLQTSDACRICLEGGEPDNPLVQKCGCIGTHGYVHETCLARWRRTAADPKAIYQCGTCKEDYNDHLTLVLLHKRLSEQRVRHGDRHGETLWTMNQLAVQLKHQGKSMQAERLLREALAAYAEILAGVVCRRDDDNKLGEGRPQVCRDADPTNPMCQLMGNYTFHATPDFNTRSLYKFMGQNCSSLAPNFARNQGC